MPVSQSRRQSLSRGTIAVIAAIVLAAIGPVVRAQDPPPQPERKSVATPGPKSVEELRQIEKRVTALADPLLKSTVSVMTRRSQGSGVIISPEGHVITAQHVVGKEGTDVTIVLSNKRRVRATTLGTDEILDVAVVKMIGVGPWPHAKQADISKVRLGDWCIATGHPEGYKNDRPAVVRLGRVVFRRDSMLQSDCTLVGGDSGGPLFNMEGEVIGIHSRIGLGSSWNFHAPLTSVTRQWDALVAGKTGRYRIGISGKDHDKGCEVLRVFPGTPGHKSGLLVGDIVMKLNAKPVGSVEDLATLVRQTAMPSVKLLVQRKGEVLEMTVEFPPPQRPSTSRGETR